MVKSYKLPVIKYVSHGNIMCGIVTVINRDVYLKVAKRIDLKNSHHQKKNCVYVM